MALSRPKIYNALTRFLGTATFQRDDGGDGWTANIVVAPASPSMPARIVIADHYLMSYASIYASPGTASGLVLSCNDNVVVNSPFKANYGITMNFGTANFIGGTTTLGIATSYPMRLVLAGDGVDGAAVLNGTNTYPWATKVLTAYALTRDVYLSSLSFVGSCTLVTNGFRVYVQLLDLSGAGAGAINWMGIAGNSGGGATGGVQGSGRLANTVGGSSQGAPGMNGSTGPGAVANAGALVTVGNGGLGGSGGAGGSGASGAGGGGGPLAPPPIVHRLGVPLREPTYGLTLVAGGGGGAGGGSGGGSLGANGGGGGGGGGGAGVVYIRCDELRTNSSTAAGAISAKGGDGGGGGNGTGIDAGGGGGAAGGGGGYIDLAYQTRSGSPVTNLVDASGGRGGNGGTGGGGVGVPGSGGAGGQSGTVVVFNIRNGTSTRPAQAAGNPASGATGGVGGLCRATI